MAEDAYPDEMSLLEARRLFFERSNLGADGGYSSRWVRVESRPIPFYFPNWNGRVAAARQHDLHHIAAGYATDWPGEAEIAAWEIASNCGGYFAAWLLDLAGINFGIVVSPRRMFRAFLRGRRAKTNLYHGPVDDSELGTISVGALRDRLGLRRCANSDLWSDRMLFFSWCVLSVSVFQLLPAALAFSIFSLLR